MKKLVSVVVALILITAVLVPGFARADTGTADITVTAKMDFPVTLTFDIGIKNSVPVNDIRLHYSVDRLKFADVISEEVVAFTPSKNVSARFVMDMRQTGGFPPGSSLTYWVTAVDANGAVSETLPQKVAIEDQRYNWKSLQQGMVTLYWYSGSNSFAQTLMDAAQQALGRVSENSGAELSGAVKIFVYTSSSDLQGALVYSQDWTGGIAFTEFGIIAIGIGTSNSEVAWGKGAISHELTHLVVHQVVFNPYNDVPPWLDEGLAMNSEGSLDTQFSIPLEEAIANDTLISVQSLSSPFSAYSDQAILAYAESYWIVKYLIDTYGRDKMLALLNVFKQGSSNNEALQAVYGFDMAGLNTRWQAAAKSVTQ